MPGHPLTEGVDILSLAELSDHILAERFANIFVVREFRRVVVMTAGPWIMDEEKFVFDMMSRYTLPACL